MSRNTEEKSPETLEEPSIPRGYKHGFCPEFLKLRLSNNEDEQLIKQMEYYLDPNVEHSDRNDYGGIIHYLLWSYPLLRKKHIEVFKVLRKNAIKCYEKKPALFKKSMKSVLDFLGPKCNEPLVPLREFDFENAGPGENPIYRLDVLYTLRILGKQAPFNAVKIPEEAIEKAEKILFSYDMVDYGQKLRYGLYSHYHHTYSRQCKKTARQKLKAKLRLIASLL